MATNFPGSLDTSTQQPTIASTDEMDDSGKEHDVVHTNHSGAIIALETKLGTGDSNATTGAVLMGTGSGTSAWDTSPTINGVLEIGQTDAATTSGRTSQTPDSSWTGHLNVLGGASSPYTGGLAIDDDGMWVGHNSSGRDLYLATNETVRMVIDGSGKACIRDDSAATVIGARLLTLRSQTSGMIPLLAWAERDVDAVSVIASIFMIGDNGDSSNPGTNDYWALFRRGNGTTIGSIKGTGSASVNFATTSDQTMKNDLGDAGDVSSIIDAMNVHRFTWKDANAEVGEQIGLFAQEALSVTGMPYGIATPAETVNEVVSTDEDGNDVYEDVYYPASIDYSKLVPLLIQEIKSLRQRVATLEG